MVWGCVFPGFLLTRAFGVMRQRTISPNPLLVFLSPFALRSRLGTCCCICGVTFWHSAVFVGPTGSAYFARVDFKNPRPWFRGYRVPRGYINLVTHLRTGHICTGEHFVSMGWDLEAGCGCGAELRSREHLFLNCPLLAGRGFSASWPADSLACRLTNLNTESLSSILIRVLWVSWGDFLSTVILYEFSGLWLVRAAPGAWSFVLPCSFAASSGWTDHLGHLSSCQDWLRTPAIYCLLIGFLAAACRLLCCSHCADHILELLNAF